MTEEIIINGVNVAGCEHFDRDSSLNNCLAHCIPYPECTCYESCDEHPNCYYKQLKRLEQENKELKEKVKELDKMTGIFSARLCDKYRSALEKIREIANAIINGKHITNDIEGHLKELSKQIITKINEVLGEN